MMRKDVKLGFAIGGVLLAVVVVYALVGTGNKDASNGGAGIVTEEPSAKNPADGATADAKNPASKPESAKTEPTTSPSSLADANRPAPPTESQPPATAPANGTNSAAGAATDSIASLALHNPADAAHDPNSDLWDKALNTGELMLSQTPTPASGSDKNIPGGGVERRDSAPQAGATQAPTGAETQARANGPATLSRASDAGASGNASTPPSSSLTTNSHAGTTHVVQKNETLAMISKAAYGSPNYYPHILRANPGLDPRKLKPGMTINLPPVSDVKPTSNGDPASASGSPSGSSSPAPSSKLDPKTEYVVESGDTLERIALKLYGKREMIDKIYELNKQSVPDRNKLKLHQVLRLPEPPTQTASR